MPTRASIVYSDTPAAAIGRLIHAAEVGVAAAVKMWHDQIMPGHFDEDAYDKYGYAHRAGQDEAPITGVTFVRGKRILTGGRVRLNRKYYWRHYRETGNHRPLDYTGDSFEQAKAGFRVTTSASLDGTVEAIGAISVPRYFFQRPRNSQVDKPKELTITLPAEIDQMQAVVTATIDAATSSAPAATEYRAA